MGIEIDSKLNFRSHVKSITAKASRKVSALFRIREYLTLKQAKVIFSSFILSNFTYCPLVWIFSGKMNDNLINKIYHRGLKAVYLDFESSFIELLDLDQADKIHRRNLRVLMLEIYKSLNKQNPEFMWDLFSIRETPYTFRTGTLLSLPGTKTTSYGSNALVFRGCSLWNTIPKAIKEVTSVEEFKNKIKTWKGSLCRCTICI